jgi:hypothetical protein
MEDDAMDVDGGWDDYPPEDDRSSGNDAGDAMEVDAEVVREALRTLSAARGHAGNEDDPEGDVAWPGTWPGIWPGTRSETGSGSQSALSAPFAPIPRTLAAAAPRISAPSRDPERVANAALSTPSEIRELTVVPDTNALVSRGDKSLSMLLDRFGSDPEAENGEHRAYKKNKRDVPRVRVAVPRRVVQELDGLKASSRRLSNGERDDGANRVAALARGVNRAMVNRLDAQHRGVDTAIAASSSMLEVQGPGDAASCRLEMKARGFLFGGDGVERVPAGDEEILFFCRTRRERGELVAFVTADANAAVSAMSHASTHDVPVCAFHPERLPKDADEMHAALVAFYQAAAARSFPALVEKNDEKAAAKKSESQTGVSSDGRPFLSIAVPPETRVGAPESKNKGGPSETRVKERGAGGPSVSPRATKNQNVSPPVSPPSSPRAHAVRVLEALDLALPAAVEFMLREALGDLWAAGVSDDFDAQNVSLCADDAFEALRKNRASLLLPNKSGGAFGTKRGADAGREAMRALALARNARGRHNELKELGSIERASQIADIVCDLLVNCPNAVPEVATAAEAAARAKRALARDKLIGS